MRHVFVTFLAYLGGMFRRLHRSAAVPAVLAAGCLGGESLYGQDSGALIDALIRKGILSQQEAEDIRADLARDAAAVVPAPAMANGRSTSRLSVGMRVQMQYAHLDTDIAGAAAQPAVIDHTALRRMYLTLRAGVGGNWGATITYDFASAGYDDAYIDWNPTRELTFNFGLRKVAVAFEERFSSGDLRGLERSSITRYFVESNNGRRLGAASYRIGAFVDGRKELGPAHTLTYGAAVTNPERNESFSTSAAFGDATNNKPALWAHSALVGRFGDGAQWLVFGGVGHLPDQGGFGTANLGRGFDLTLCNAALHVTTPRAGLMAEFLAADVERGRANGSDATVRGFYIMPTLMLTETIEAVVRYAWLDSDGRGVTLNDVIRSSASGGIMNESTEWYAGANLYLRGNDLKFQLGAVRGKTRDTLAGAAAEAKATGVRSQMQIQF
jgi:hypothetical protein